MMHFKSIDEAKMFACAVTSSYLNEEDALKKLKTYKTYLKNSSTVDEKKFWNEEIKSLEDWLSSDKFKAGNYAQGIDALILELVEWRSSLFAFESVEVANSPFVKHLFHAQWLMGAAYTTICIVGKLVSKHRNDNSLIKIWNNLYQIMLEDQAVTEAEAKSINELLDKTDGYFTNGNSHTIHFRNKVIAHNEKSPIMEWHHLDNDIKLLVRIWSLIVSWCSFGIMNPFTESSIAFSGLDNVFSNNEIHQLKVKREEYLTNVKVWCNTNIATGEKYLGKDAFATLSVSFTINKKETS